MPLTQCLDDGRESMFSHIQYVEIGAWILQLFKKKKKNWPILKALIGIVEFLHVGLYFFCRNFYHMLTSAAYILELILKKDRCACIY